MISSFEFFRNNLPHGFSLLSCYSYLLLQTSLGDCTHLLNASFHFHFLSAELEDREYQATLHVRDSVQLVENALLEKEQVRRVSNVN